MALIIPTTTLGGFFLGISNEDLLIHAPLTATFGCGFVGFHVGLATTVAICKTMEHDASKINTLDKCFKEQNEKEMSESKNSAAPILLLLLGCSVGLCILKQQKD